MGLFHRDRDPEVEAAKEAAKTAVAEGTKQVRVQEIEAQANLKVEEARREANAKIERRVAYGQRYDQARMAAAEAKGAAAGASDAAKVGRTPGMRLLHGAANVVQKLSGPPPSPARVVRTEETVGGKRIITETRYPGGGGGGRRVIPAFQAPGARPRRAPQRPAGRTVLVEKSPGVYERVHVPAPAPAQRPRQAGVAFPAFSTAGLGSAPALGGFGVGGGKAKKGRTGIPFIDGQ